MVSVNDVGKRVRVTGGYHANKHGELKELKSKRAMIRVPCGQWIHCDRKHVKVIA